MSHPVPVDMKKQNDYVAVVHIADGDPIAVYLIPRDSYSHDERCDAGVHANMRYMQRLEDMEPTVLSSSSELHDQVNKQNADED